jgi:hypothetical protein
MSGNVEIVTTGGLFSDAADALGDAVDSVWDALDDLPGFKQLGEGTKALFKGPLKDFANTAVGQTVLRAITGMGMAVSAGVAGPWAMMASASLPGVLAGQPFEQALISENLYRATEAIKILSGNQIKLPDIFPPELQDIATQSFQALDKLKQKASEMGVSVEKAVEKLAAESGMSDDLERFGRSLAREMGLREDFVVQAIEMATKQKLLSHEDYDLATGKGLRPLVDGRQGVISSFGRPSTPVAKALKGATLQSKAPAQKLAQQAIRATTKSPIAAALKGVTLLPGTTKKPSPILASVVRSATPNFKPLTAPGPAPTKPMMDASASSFVAEKGGSLFWEKYKTPIMVGAGVAVVGGLAWYFMRKS